MKIKLNKQMEIDMYSVNPGQMYAGSEDDVIFLVEMSSHNIYYLIQIGSKERAAWTVGGIREFVNKRELVEKMRQHNLRRIDVSIEEI